MMPSCLRVILLVIIPMTDRQPARIGVECYAGHRGEQTPHRLLLGDRRMAVAEPARRVAGARLRGLHPRGADGDTYLAPPRLAIRRLGVTMFRTERVDRR